MPTSGVSKKTLMRLIAFRANEKIQNIHTENYVLPTFVLFLIPCNKRHKEILLVACDLTILCYDNIFTTDTFCTNHEQH